MRRKNRVHRRKSESGSENGGQRTFVYDDNLDLVEEELPDNVTLKRSYDDTDDRPDGIEIENANYKVEYAYEEVLGRLDTVKATFDTGSFTSTYSYVPDSQMVAEYDIGDLEREVAYESSRDLVDTVENTYNQTTAVSKFDYTNDTTGRQSEVSTGENGEKTGLPRPPKTRYKCANRSGKKTT